MKISGLERQKKRQLLVSEIQHHDDQYWSHNNPEISDNEYDKLHVELKELDNNSPELKKVHTPTVRSRGKVTHDIKMLSLDKAYDVSEVIAFAEKVARSEEEIFLVQPKHDGVSAELFEKVLSTRGDGNIGDDITDKGPIIEMEVLGFTGPLVTFTESSKRIRGEIIMKHSVFADVKGRILRKDGSEYKIPRSAVVGLLGQDKVDISNGLVLTFVAFNFYNQILTLEQMRTYDWQSFIDQVQGWDYPTDGLVIKLSDEEYSESLGNTSHHPRGQIALKHGNPKKESTILGIEWSMGKNKLTPVGLIEPIELAGAEIKRVSLHNAKFILDMNLQVNDQVIIERCGEIIPHVLGKANKQDNNLQRTAIKLSKCPVCDGQIEYKEPELYCLNETCDGKIVNRLNDSVSRLGIDYLAKATIEKMINTLEIKDIFDVLTITREDVSKLEGFKKQSTDNLIHEIQTVIENPIEDWKILACLNIHGIGRSLSKKLLTHMTFSELRNIDESELTLIDSVGYERARIIRQGLHDNTKLIDNLLSLWGNIKETKDAETLGNICFTGKSDRPRNFWKQKAETKGYNVCSSVNKDVGLLVTNNPDSQSNKMKKARKQGTKIISYDDFEAMS